MKTYKKGISLIVLVVTIIVLAILASAVIISLSNANIISQANNARFKSDMQSYKQAYELYVAEQTMAHNGVFNRTNITTVQLENILGTIKDEYKENMIVESGKLVYVTNDSEQKDILVSIGMLAQTTNYTQADIDASNGKLVAIGKTNPLYAVAAYNDDFTEVTMTKNSTDSDGKIRDNAFSENTTLISVWVSEGIDSLGKSAFYECTSLTNIHLPNTLTTLVGAPFEGCISLTSIVIPGSVKIISAGTFIGCRTLSNVVISDGVEQINSIAFSSCTSLEIFNLPASVQYASLENVPNLKTVNCECGPGQIELYLPEGVTVNYNVSM